METLVFLLIAIASLYFVIYNMNKLCEAKTTPTYMVHSILFVGWSCALLASVTWLIAIAFNIGG